MGTANLENDKSLPGVEPDKSFYAAFNVISQVAYGNAIYAALQLRIPNILAKAEEEGKRALTADEILEQLPTKSESKPHPGSDSSTNLIRLLRPSVRQGLLKESLGDQNQPSYSLTDVARWFVRGKVCNLLDVTDVLADPDFQSAYYHLSDFILDETIVPFDESQKTSLFQRAEDDANFGNLLHRSLAGLSNIEFVGLIDGLRQYGALDDVKTLVEVGGGTGTAVAAVVARSPNITGINFDRPDVIAKSPKHERVEHVGGNFFESVPSGDLMLLKRTIHDYGDEDAVRILKSCFQALPNKGKVIIAEYLVKDWHDTNPKAELSVGMDLFLMTVLKGGRVRSGADHKRILERAGFSDVKLIELPGCLDLVQAIKE